MRVQRSEAIAFAALFIALGGTGIAAVDRLRPGSVGNVHLRPGAVTTGKIATGAISTRTIHAQAVGPESIRLGSLDSRVLAVGGVGWESLSTDAQRRALGIIQRESARLTLRSDSDDTFTLTCPSGVAIGGGANAAANSVLIHSYPLSNASRRSWIVRLRTTGAAASGAVGYVICTSAT